MMYCLNVCFIPEGLTLLSNGAEHRWVDGRPLSYTDWWASRR